MSIKYSTLSSSTMFFQTKQHRLVIQHRCGLQYTNFYPGALLCLIFFLHFMSLTTPHPLSFLMVHAVHFIVAEPLGWFTHTHIDSYKISSTDRWNAVRLSSASVFTASLHAKVICEGQQAAGYLLP